MRRSARCALAAAIAAGLVLGTGGLPASAVEGSPVPQAKEHIAVDLSAAKKRPRRARRIDPAGAAMLGAVGSLFGFIASRAAEDAYRERYYPYGYYRPYGYYEPYGYYRPYPYGPGPYYYRPY